MLQKNSWALLGGLGSGSVVTVNYKGRLGFASSQNEAMEKELYPWVGVCLADAEYQGSQDVWGRKFKGPVEDSR